MCGNKEAACDLHGYTYRLVWMFIKSMNARNHIDQFVVLCVFVFFVFSLSDNYMGNIIMISRQDPLPRSCLVPPFCECARSHMVDLQLVDTPCTHCVAGRANRSWPAVPPHSLHLLRSRPYSQMLVPSHSLHRSRRRPC